LIDQFNKFSVNDLSLFNSEIRPDFPSHLGNPLAIPRIHPMLEISTSAPEIELQLNLLPKILTDQ
jgi:hypothetical protein